MAPPMADGVAISPRVDEAMDVAPPPAAARQHVVWMGSIELGPACIPGLSLTCTDNDSGVFDGLPRQAHAEVVSVIPTAFCVGAVMNCRNDSVLRLGGRCTPLTGRFIRAWRNSGATLLLRFGRVQILARAARRRGCVADCAVVRELTHHMSEALDTAAFRKLLLGVVGREFVHQPPECVARLPVVRLDVDGQMQRVEGKRWVDENSFGNAMKRFDISKKHRPVGTGLRPPIHHSEVAALERQTLKKQDALRKRPRSSTPVTLTENTTHSSLARSANASGTSVTLPTCVPTPVAVADGSPTLVNPAVADMGGGGGRRSGSSSCTLFNPFAKGTQPALVPATTVVSRPKSDPAHALRLGRRKRLQQQAAVRAASNAAEAQKSRPTHTVQQRRRASLDGERERQAPTQTRRLERSPGVSFLRAVDQVATFLDCSSAATYCVSELAKLLVPSCHIVDERDACVPAHNVEFATDRKDPRDEALWRYEQEVGRTEMEHSSAVDKMLRGGGAKLAIVGQALEALDFAPLAKGFDWRNECAPTPAPIPRRKKSAAAGGACREPAVPVNRRAIMVVGREATPQAAAPAPAPDDERAAVAPLPTRRKAKLPSYMRAALTEQGDRQS